jgi:hypothetical protein
MDLKQVTPNGARAPAEGASEPNQGESRWLAFGKKALAGVTQVSSQVASDMAQQQEQAATTAHAQTEGAIFDRADQLEKIRAALLPGETIEAVFDLKGVGTGFLGITSSRVIFLDKVFLRKMKAVVSISYSRIISIGAKDEAGLLTSRGFFSSSQVYITTANSEHEFDFRGADKAHIAHNLIIKHLLER